MITDRFLSTPFSIRGIALLFRPLSAQHVFVDLLGWHDLSPHFGYTIYASPASLESCPRHP